MIVLNISECAKDAYLTGYRRFIETGRGIKMDGVIPEEFELSYFTETAEYANVTAPHLRALSGFDDRGMGTFTEDREVLLVNQDQAEEIASSAGWIDGETVAASDVFNYTIHEAWENGVHDAVFSREKDEKYMDLRID